MKRLTILICTLFVILHIVAYDFEVGGIYYNITSTSNLTVSVAPISSGNNSFYSSYKGDVVIPENVTYGNRTFKVNAIADGAFWSCGQLKSVSLPKTIITIGELAFNYCTELTELYIPTSVSSIGYGAFRYCKKIQMFSIPNSTLEIGDEIFQNCTALEKVDLGTSLVKIGVGAFRGCNSLTSINIPKSVTTIKDDAFSGCTRLTSFSIPNSVESIGNAVFYGCSNLKEIAIPPSITIIPDKAFYGCSKLETVMMPNTITSIGTESFCGCSSLSSITIPSSVSKIGTKAFYGDLYLSQIICDCSTPPTCNDVFPGKVLLDAVLYVPERTDSLFRSKECWKDFVNIVEGAPNVSTVRLSITVNKGGKISLLNTTVEDGIFSTAIEKGEDILLQIEALQDYEISSIEINGTDLTSNIIDGFYSIDNISDDLIIVVNFEKKEIPDYMDTNGDGAVNSADIVAIYNYIINGTDARQ